MVKSESWAIAVKRRVLSYCSGEASLGLLLWRDESWATVAKRRVLGYCGEEFLHYYGEETSLGLL